MTSAMAVPYDGDNHNLGILQQRLDLCVRCNQCCIHKSEISFILQEHSHRCLKNILLVRLKGKNNLWKQVIQLPSGRKPSKYEVCRFYTENKGCVMHRLECTYARSEEEAYVWNFMKKECLELQRLINLVDNDVTSPCQQGKIDKILDRFGGTFSELCKTCFHGSPHKYSSNVSDKCTAGHRWNPVFVFCQKDKQKGVSSASEIRPLPKQKNQQWSYCKYTEQKCRHGFEHCWFAHNQVEMIVWTLESKGQLDRSSLLHTFQGQGTKEETQQYYCQVCNCQFLIYEDYMNHCFTEKHRRLIFEDTSSTWRYRDPPLMSNTFELCDKIQTCEYGDNCIKAHSMKELKEWKKRHRALQRKGLEAAETGLLSYQDSLLEEYWHSKDKTIIMMEKLSEVSVDCDSDLSVFVRQEKISHRWKFNIASESILEVVALLKHERGATFTLGKLCQEERSYSTGIWFENQAMPTTKKKYEITVTFTSDRPGFYEQWLVFDFDMRPVLLKKLSVRVGEQLYPQPEQDPDFEITQQNINASTLEPEKIHVEQVPVIWHEGSVEIVPFLKRSEAQEELLKTYSHVKKKKASTTIIQGLINHQNYKDKMHNFLYQEERTQDQLVGRLNLRGTMSLKNHLFEDWFGFKNAISGELFGSVSVPYTLTPDTQKGYLLKRHVQSVLVAPLRTDCDPQRVYEAEILKDAVGESQLNLCISSQCCTELQLQSNTEIEMEIQFLLNRIHFCEMHKAIDILPDLKRVLPDLSDRNVSDPIKSSPSELNKKQQAAMDFILEGANQRSSAPLLIYGPFGTGKTLTLAKITLALAQQAHNKILICTHTNSSADLYVKDHFHSSVTTAKHPARPLRIKAEENSVRTTHPITLQYCHLSTNLYGRMSFSFPEKQKLDGARIIITTTGVARFFHDMQLPSNYFSHILIDEASQMLECEALMALGLAGEKTQVVLAGDHMQMGPKLFSVGVDERSERTLLSRLFHYYQAENTTTAKNSRIIFNENYRSTKEIVEFVSTNFYVGKKDVIKASGNVNPHPNQNALQFYHVRGHCYLDKYSMSWFNPEQIQTVVEVLQKVLNDWPNEWLHPDPASLCVLSQGSQVTELRKTLKRYCLQDVTVENAENVQGKQFRVIIISTVHTKDSLNMTEQPCLEFFSDVRLLNTAMTRAQSQVFVVGDATALCCSHFGKCWRLWKSYINHCVDTGSVHPEDFTIDSLKQELLEISNIIKSEDDDSSDSESTTSDITESEDPILKELLDETNDLQIQLTEDGLFPHFHTASFENHVRKLVKDSNPPQIEPHEMSQNNKICKLVLDRYDSGFAKPLDEPGLHIEIKGRKNVGCSVTGDVVKVEILPSETLPPKGKVTEVLQHTALLREFVCTIDNYDNQLMQPINICFPKLFTPFWKDKPNHIAIRNPKTLTVDRFLKINEEARRNNLFVVKFLQWRPGFMYPLGIAVQVLPRVTSFEDGLKVLEKEYNLNRSIPSAVEREMANLSDATLHREDFRNLMTFTIDPSDTEDLDDAISVRDLGQHYEIGVHIADVASFVTKDSELDKYAQKQGTTFYVSNAEPTHMFPKNLITELFSLHPNADRYCISLMTEVDKKTDRIRKRTFSKSVICSKKKLSYDDAETILKTSDNQHSFESIEGCLAIACHFAEVHRKERKQKDWCYQQPDEDVEFGRRRSHQLVEELMIMYNHTVADRLLFEKKTTSLTPLRCQAEPNSDQLHDFQDRNVALLPMSIHLSYKVGDCRPEFHKQLSLNGMKQSYKTKQVSSFDCEYFPILTSLLKKLKIAALHKDIHKIADLILTDDIHPQLLPLVIELRKLLNKSQVLRANSSYLSRIGHYDLQLDSYTWASSPIRRYIDVIVQRLLHSVLDNTEIIYTSHEIDKCCVEFAQKNDYQASCQKKSEALSYASQLSTQNARKMAYVVEVTPMKNNFWIFFPLNRNSIPNMVRVMYRDLQLADQPMPSDTNDCMVLKWVRRVYSFSDHDIRKKLKQQQANSLTTNIPKKYWKCLVAAISEENWELLYHMITQITTFQPVKQNPATSSRTGISNLKEEHYTELSLELKKGKIIEVQLGTDTDRGLLVPAVQLFIVNQKFEICMEHTKNPIMCFSKFAFQPSRSSYNNYMNYQQIWNPLCKMESASSAVAENESIVIEDVILNWQSSKKQKGLEGSFRLPFEKKAQWAIEGSLRNCFLCIRLRIPQKDLVLKHSLTQCQDIGLLSVPGLIWIAHGVVTDVSETEMKKKDDYMEIIFRINHMPMTDIPEFVFSKSAKFTVELIPKLLPDVRKENAIDNLTKANDLVKAIATGKKTSNRCKIQTSLPTRLEIQDHQSLGFPKLNNSQCESIKEALKNEFTLIQGPPGTGKTVVGVHIVYWFFQENKKFPPVKKEKKRSILYCGPSNKSVDVVAGQLLKLQHQLRPLRVYSDQMEILEFPYPGSNLRLSRHSQRVEKPKKDIRSITLHHKIRMASNPFSTQIQAFDLKIQRSQQLTEEELKTYKDCLKKARKHELLQHDVILCTCTAAAHPLLAEVLSVQQIIIDECAMATEPEAFIPFVTHKPKQIVLLGDHKQLQPVVRCELLQKLGMSTSLFERYMMKALMLDTQYRMQEDICAFPSEEFYEGKLKTGTKSKPRLFQTILKTPTSIIFGHVKGEEIRLVVSTEQGNENSKANMKEVKEAVRIAECLIGAGIQSNDIAILTPYNAQVAKIKEKLLGNYMQQITVSTIMKSQGSEWRYVILTTVCSCPDIEEKPSRSWLLQRLGFVMDPNQVNVGITRAQEGLCIIGNKDLLWCSPLWRKLLKHYQTKGCLVDPANNIQIAFNRALHAF